MAAVGVDPENFAMARIAPDGQFSGRSSEKTGRISPIQAQS